MGGEQRTMTRSFTTAKANFRCAKLMQTLTTDLQFSQAGFSILPK